MKLPIIFMHLLKSNISLYELEYCIGDIFYNKFLQELIETSLGYEECVSLSTFQCACSAEVKRCQRILHKFPVLHFVA